MRHFAGNTARGTSLLRSMVGLVLAGLGCSDGGTAVSPNGPSTTVAATTTTGGDSSTTAGGGSSTTTGPATSASTTTGTGGVTATGGNTAGVGGTGGVSYARDVEPIFDDYCADCHHQDITVIPNIEDPFDPDNGLVNSVNTWAEFFPDTPALNLVPGDPENSFIMDKITDMAIEAGAFMPWQPARLTAEELGALRQWISDGALDDAFFQANIRPIFGVPDNLSSAAGKCTWCHHATGLPPNLSDPFDPEDGVVNVEAIIGAQMRVAPGDPDNSFLVVKVEATAASTEIGEPMPLAHPPLSTENVETIRRWIAEGAENN